MDSDSRARWRRTISYAAVAVAGGLALGWLSTPVSAQTAALTSTQTTVLKKMTVTATRSAKALFEVPRSVSVIDGESLQKRVVRDIQDLTRYEPGVFVNRSASATRPWATLNEFVVRGVGDNRVKVQLDGSRTMEAIIDGSRDVVDPWNMKAVEIVKGPSSVLWGADALGGIVAYRTLDPEDLLDETDNPYRFEFKTAYDSYDSSFKAQLNAAFEVGDFQILGSIGGGIAHEPKLSNARADGGIWGCNRQPKWACNLFYPTDTDSYNGLAKVVWTPSADHKIKLTGEFFSRHSAVDQVDFSANAVTSNPVGLQYINDWVRNVDVKRTRLALEHEWNVGAEWLDSVNWKVSYSPQRRGTFSDRTQTYFNRYTTSYAVRDYGETFLEGQVQLLSTLDWNGTVHKLTYGVDGDLAKSDYVDTTRSYNSLTNVTTNTSYSGFAFPDVETVRGGFFIQDEIKLFDERLTITPGMRLAYYKLDPTKGKAPAPLPGLAPEVIENLSLIKSVSARYEFTDELSAYASYDEGFKMPTGQQLFVSSIDPFSGAEVIPNPNLKPESVKSYEIGLKGEFDQGYFAVSAFHADYTDFIQRLVEVGPDQFSSVNIGKVNLWGIEFSGEYEIATDLFLHGAATYQYGRQKRSAALPEEFYQAAVPFTAVAGLRYEIPDRGLEFDVVSTLAMGPKDRNDPNAFKPDGYMLLDAFAKWEPTDNIEISFGVQNIFDTRYFPNTMPVFSTIPGPGTSNEPPELYTGPGRTFKLGANVSF